MENLLKQALVAAEQKDWLVVNECLQQLLNSEAIALGEKEIEQVLDLALAVLESGDFQERWQVAKVFPKLGKVAIAPLIEVLKDDDADLELRWFTGRILAEFQDPAVVTALVDMLKTAEDEELVEMAATALTNLGKLAIEPLTKLLEEDEFKLLAVRSLCTIRSSETIPPLLGVVNDPEVEVRAAAIEALSSFHDPQVPPILIQALKDIAAPVRKEAVRGLSVRVDLREQLNLIDALKPLLLDFNLEVCESAATALGRLGTNPAAEALFAVLKSQTTPIPLQIAVVRALAWVGTVEALEYLKEGLSITSLEVCQEIVTLLGRLEDLQLKSKAAKISIAFLHSGQPAAQETTIKQALALALGELGLSEALPELILLLADKDEGVRLHAIAAMKKLAPDKAHQKLQQLVTQKNLNPDLQQGIAIALAEW